LKLGFHLVTGFLQDTIQFGRQRRSQNLQQSINSLRSQFHETWCPPGNARLYADDIKANTTYLDAESKT
jgi:hypothetical protein